MLSVALLALAFASTNLDNLVLLMAWLLAPETSRGTIFWGYLTGMLGVLALAVMIGLVGYLFPVGYLGYLGLVPIAVGLKSVFDLMKNRSTVEELPAGTSTLTVATTQLSNGVDSVLVFGPLLADSLSSFDVTIMCVFLTMILAWFATAALLSRQLSRRRGIAAAGRWLAPIVMIIVGVYILIDTATDVVI